MKDSRTAVKVRRSEPFCSYRSFRFNELVHAHYFREGQYPSFILMRDYFRRATAVTLRDYTPSRHPLFVNV